jgi:hypothetical protein
MTEMNIEPQNPSHYEWWHTPAVPVQEYPTQKRTGKVVQVVRLLPSKHEALSSNPNTTKKNLFYSAAD